MKKVVISLVTLSSIVLLAACGQSNTASTSSSSSSKAKTSQTSASSSSKAKSESSKAASQETAAAMSAESSTAAASETSASSSASAPAEKPVENQPAAKNVADVASFAGTWANDRGETVTVNADGSIVTTNAAGDSFNLALWFNQDTQGVGFYTVYAPGASAGSAGLLYIPANVTNPHIGTTDARETLVIGQDVSADEHPYYRQ